MKNILLFTLALFSNLIFSQDYTGFYYKEIKSKNGEKLEYSFHLNNDFTYVIEFKRNLNQFGCKTEIFKGQGTWKQEKHKIIFYPKPCECDKEIDLTGTTSRYKNKDYTELVFFNFKENWSLNVGMKKLD